MPCARLCIVAPHLVGPDRAGVVDIDVDLARAQRIENDGGAKALAGRGRKAGVAQALPDQGGQNILLGERLGADRIGGARLRKPGHQCRKRQQR